jgi:WD40 repeat protein
MWNLDNELDQKTLEGHTGILDMAFSHAGVLLASASKGHLIRVWDMERLPSHEVLRGHEHMVMAVALAPNGNQLASASWWDQTVRIWDAERGVQLKVVSQESGLLTLAGIRWESQLQHLMRDPGPSNAIQLWGSIGQKLLLSIDSIDYLLPTISPQMVVLWWLCQRTIHTISGSGKLLRLARMSSICEAIFRIASYHPQEMGVGLL